jgi:ferrous iron transport protein B
MSQVSNRPTLTVALIGNPNTGKSTLFNALAGVRQRVGNYPGVTVEKKIAEMRDGACRYELIDLPGTYSLAPRSPDEMIAVDVLLGRRDDLRPPDAVICVVDASNLERNLYLVSQVLEMGRPTVIALNMIDVARDRAIHLDVERLGRQIGVPIVELQANRRIGISELKAALGEVVGKAVGAKPNPFPDVFQDEVRALASTLSKANGAAGHSLPSAATWRSSCRRRGLASPRQVVRCRPSRRWLATSG